MKVTRESTLQQIESFPRLAQVLSVAEEEMDDDPGHDLEHCLRVAGWAAELAPTEHVELALAGGLLHDIVNVPKDSPLRSSASELSANRAAEILAESGFDPVERAAVHRAILNHSFSRGATPETPLGAALQDADRLEAVGAIGIARTFSTGAKMGAQYAHPVDPWAQARELDDRSFTVDHFFKKLLRLPASFQTQKGQREARRRIKIMSDFLVQLGVELGKPGAEFALQALEQELALPTET